MTVRRHRRPAGSGGLLRRGIPADRARAAWVLTCGIVALATAWPLRVAAADDLPAAATSDTLSFVLADWQAVALGRQVAGAAGWVTAADGTLRLDLTMAAAPEDSLPEPGLALLSRQGRGWTLITDADGTGVYGAWDREWKPAPAGLTGLAIRIVALTAATGSGPVSRRLVLAVDPAVAAAAAGAAAERAGGGFRQGLAARGRGGGGPGERVSARAAGDGGRVRIRSSRRPGWLDVLPRERRTAVGTPDEIFLPWWPLGDVLTFLPER